MIFISTNPQIGPRELATALIDKMSPDQIRGFAVAALVASAELLDTIEATGGLTECGKFGTAPVASDDWSDLALAARTAENVIRAAGVEFTLTRVSAEDSDGDWCKGLHKGDEVTWNDPDEGECSVTGIIDYIQPKGDGVVWLSLSNGWSSEVNLSELS